MRRSGKPASLPKLCLITVFCTLAIFFCKTCPSALADTSREARAVNIVAATLHMLGEEDLVNRFLDDYYLNGRIRIADLGGEGVNAETGPEGLSGWVWGLGENAMTLDDGILALADAERIWEKRHFSPALPVVSWAVTVYHEYIHMDQKNPKNEPYYEDPAWQATDRALARWCERLRKQFDDLKNKPASDTKVDKLEQLEEILRQLQGEVTAFQEGVTANIREGN